MAASMYVFGSTRCFFSRRSPPNQLANSQCLPVPATDIGSVPTTCTTSTIIDATQVQHSCSNMQQRWRVTSRRLYSANAYTYPSPSLEPCPARRSLASTGKTHAPLYDALCAQCALAVICTNGGTFVAGTPPWNDSHRQSASSARTFRGDVLLLVGGHVVVWCGGAMQTRTRG